MTRVNSIDDLPPRAREQARRQLSEHGKPAATTAEPKPTPRFTNVRSVTSDGLKVPSKGQAARHEHLLRLQAIGTIWGLESEVPFALIVNGVKVGDFYADEVYLMHAQFLNTIERVIEDFKAVPTKRAGKRRGEGTATALYKLKRDIMGAMGLRVREVHRPTSPAGHDERKP
jgi:hypothetical protein